MYSLVSSNALFVYYFVSTRSMFNKHSMDIHVYLHQTVKKGNESFQENNVFVVVNFFISGNFYFSIVFGYGNIC